MVEDAPAVPRILSEAKSHDEKDDGTSGVKSHGQAPNATGLLVYTDPARSKATVAQPSVYDPLLLPMRHTGDADEVVKYTFTLEVNSVRYTS